MQNYNMKVLVTFQPLEIKLNDNEIFAREVKSTTLKAHNDLKHAEILHTSIQANKI